MTGHCLTLCLLPLCITFPGGFVSSQRYELEDGFRGIMSQRYELEDGFQQRRWQMQVAEIHKRRMCSMFNRKGPE